MFEFIMIAKFCNIAEKSYTVNIIINSEFFDCNGLSYPQTNHCLPTQITVYLHLEVSTR